MVGLWPFPCWEFANEVCLRTLRFANESDAEVSMTTVRFTTTASLKYAASCPCGPNFLLSVSFRPPHAGSQIAPVPIPTELYAGDVWWIIEVVTLVAASQQHNDGFVVAQSESAFGTPRSPPLFADRWLVSELTVSLKKFSGTRLTSEFTKV